MEGGEMSLEETYRKALEDDASGLWRVTNQIKKEIESRYWITEGRGCYEWNDERYRDETRLAFEAVLKLIENVQHPAQRRFHEVLTNRQRPIGKELLREGYLEMVRKQIKEEMIADGWYLAIPHRNDRDVE